MSGIKLSSIFYAFLQGRKNYSESIEEGFHQNFEA